MSHVWHVEWWGCKIIYLEYLDWVYYNFSIKKDLKYPAIKVLIMYSYIPIQTLAKSILNSLHENQWVGGFLCAQVAIATQQVMKFGSIML